MNNLFAKRVIKLIDPTVQNTLKLASKKGVISLSGGIPNPDLFPVQEIESLLSTILKRNGKNVLQYSQTAGLPELRALIANNLSVKWRKKVSPEEILITSGSQQGLDLLGKAFLDKNDYVIVENPTYFVALSAFNSYETKYKAIRLNSDGIDVKQLTRILDKSIKRVKFLYVIPTFQNPSGITWSKKVREEIIGLIKKHRLLLIEDDPYSELYFNNKPPLNLASYNHGGLIIHLGTFSKTLCPGLRVGYIAASKEIIEKLSLIKQGVDLHSSTLSQALIAGILKQKSTYEMHLKKIRNYYKEQSRYMLLCLNKYLIHKATWNVPAGGIFIWIKTKRGDCRILNKQAVDSGVTFMPGYPFYANTPKDNTLRITFATVNKREIQKGIKILSNII